MSSIFETLQETILEEWRDYHKGGGQMNPLEGSSIQSQKSRDDALKRQFEEYERRHFVVENSVYLSMLGCEEAYKPPQSRNTFLDNTTSYQEGVSTERIAVYLKGMYSFQELYICIHGTRLTSVEDILQDLQIIENSISNTSTTLKYLNDIASIRQAFKGISDDNIYISGHSLGAVYSLLSSKILNTNGFGFNGASSLINLQLFYRNYSVLEMVYNIRNIQDYSRFVSYRLNGDPISVLSKWSLNNVVTINVEGIFDLSPLARHSMTSLTTICIPVVPLDNTSLSRARRSGRLEDLRGEIKKEGEEFAKLRDDTEGGFIDKMLGASKAVGEALVEASQTGLSMTGQELADEVFIGAERIEQAGEVVVEQTEKALTTAIDTTRGIREEIVEETQEAVDNIGETLETAGEFIKDVWETERTWTNPMNWF